MTSQQNVSKSSRPISFVGMNIHQIKSELNAQLDNQEELLEKSASPISRNAIMKQTGVLRKELKGLNKYNQQDEIPEELRLKLETLANEFQQIKTTKALRFLLFYVNFIFNPFFIRPQVLPHYHLL